LAIKEEVSGDNKNKDTGGRFGKGRRKNDIGEADEKSIESIDKTGGGS